MKRIARRIYTSEFKREAIKLVTEQGLTLAEVSRKLDVATKSLRTWMDQQQRGELRSSLGASKLTVDQQRIHALQLSYGMKTSMSLKGNAGTMRRWRASLVHSKRKACITTTLTPVSKLDRVAKPPHAWAWASGSKYLAYIDIFPEPHPLRDMLQ